MLTITNEDNMELMARYPDKYFDLAIVDPPYGIGISSNPVRQKHKKRVGIIQYQLITILMNYLGYQKIKLFGVAIILIYHQRKVFLFGIKNNLMILV